jgi:hypothetical protein
MKRKTVRVNLSNSERKYPFFKGELRGSVQVPDKNACPTVGAGLGFPGSLAPHLQSWMFWLKVLLVWWSERDKG